MEVSGRDQHCGGAQGTASPLVRSLAAFGGAGGTCVREGSWPPGNLPALPAQLCSLPAQTAEQPAAQPRSTRGWLPILLPAGPMPVSGAITAGPTPST